MGNQRIEPADFDETLRELIVVVDFSFVFVINETDSSRWKYSDSLVRTITTPSEFKRWAIDW